MRTACTGGAPALAYYRGGLINDYPDQAVEVVWLSSRQLDRRDLPRRASSVAGPKAQGWYVDPTGRHELRWFSVGRPTYLVRDGAVEGRDEQLMED